MQTMQRMKIPVLVIGQVLGLGFLTRYSGTDAVLGLAFTGAGFFYPFFAAYLGWLGVFLTGSDTASNALFGSLQRITAQQLNLNRDPDRGDQLDRWRHGQDDRCAVDHGGVRGLLRRSEGARRTHWDRSSGPCSGIRLPAPP